MSDDFEAFPDHFLSVYQSMASEVAAKLDARAGQSRSREPRRSYSSVLPAYAQQIARREFTATRGLEPAPTLKAADRALGGTDVAKVCAELAYRYLKARVTGDAAVLEQVRGEFKAGTCDPAWASTIEEYVRFFGPNGTRNQIPYVRAAQVGPRTIEIKSDSCVALLADWGTGGSPAMSVLKSAASHVPDVLVHLGDVYYSGTPLEWRTNFVEPVEQIIRSRLPETLVYCLSATMTCTAAA